MKWYPHGPALASKATKPTVVFQVEDELFQIPDTVFPASEIFREMYPVILEGKEPVILRDCTKMQFEAFLTVILQPHSHMFNSKHPCNYSLLLETLLPAFELAKKWGFHQLAEDIGDQAGPLMSSPVQRIAVGHRYNVLPWYRSGLEDLVASDDDITLEDADDIGFPLALRLYHARARYARNIRDRTLDDKGVVASEIVGDMFVEDLAIFLCLFSGETNEGFEVITQQERTDTEVILPEGQTPSHAIALATEGLETASATKNVETNPSDPTHEHHIASNSNGSDASVLIISTDIARDLIRAIIDLTSNLRRSPLMPEGADRAARGKSRRFLEAIWKP
ncbi:hypothetical protein MPER_05743 [Moniliophthora perniciosa FA553]|nr:hypothetical protein MPER_05743 [Moniliophthora perniciosa FA553]